VGYGSVAASTAVVKKTRPTILLVDDDSNDLLLLETAFGRAASSARIQSVGGGQQAIAYLSGKPPYADRTKYELPDFIITDLKMPGVDGFAVLEFLRTRSELAAIPTVVFSGSRDNDDIKKSHWLGAASYHVKPSDPAALLSLVQALHGYWITCERPEMDGTATESGTNSGFKLGDRFVAAPRPDGVYTARPSDQST
jgi:CheY-like chemotaxis protein